VQKIKNYDLGNKYNTGEIEKCQRNRFLGHNDNYTCTCSRY